MKPKQIVLLSLILGVLVFGILLKARVRLAEDRAGSDQGYGVVADFVPAQIERIVIAEGVQSPSVELVKEEGTWKIKTLWNAKADQTRVESFLQKLRSVQGELRGTGKNLFPDFGIQDAAAISIKLMDADQAPRADLRLGKKRAGEQGYFLRKGSGEAVYLVDLNMAELLGIHVDFEKAKLRSEPWADLSLFVLDPEKVTQLTVYHLQGEARTRALGLVREADPQDPAKSLWKFMRKDMNSSVDPGKVLKFIATLASVKAQKVVDPAGKEYGLEKPVWQLGVNEGGQKTLLNAGPKAAKEELYYVKTSSENSVFSLNAGYFDDLNSDDARFVKEDVSAVAPEKKA